MREMQNIQEKLEAVRSLFEGVANGVYTCREHVVERGRRMRFAFYFAGRLCGGISEEAYAANKEAIDQIRAEVERARQEKELRRSWITLALADELLAYAGTSWETGLKYFQLRVRVPHEVWQRVAPFAVYEEEGGDCEAPTSGWVFIGTYAEEARKILRKLAEEKASRAHFEEAEKLRSERRAKEEARLAREARLQEIRKLLDEILVAFENAEKPDPRVEQPDYARQFATGFEKMRVEGERIDDPLEKEDPYGHGRWFVLQEPDWIWLIEKHGADGDDWGQNNVDTGGAGAIGLRVRWDAELAEKIRQVGALARSGYHNGVPERGA